MTKANISDNSPDSTPAITATETMVDKVSQEAKAAEMASSIFDAAPTCTSHPYLTAKGIKGHGIRKSEDNLLIPLRDSASTSLG